MVQVGNFQLTMTAVAEQEAEAISKRTNDAATHLDANGQGVDNDGRPDSAISSNTTSDSTPLSGDFSFNMTKAQFVDMMSQANISLSRMDDRMYPRVVDGARACPPEDSGGSYGYADLVEILAKPRHKEYRQMLSTTNCSPRRFVPL